MKFKNISKETKHIKADGTWLAVQPSEVFEVNLTLGRLHLDPELEKVIEKEPKTTECSCVPEDGGACSDCSEEKKAISKKYWAEKEAEKKSEKAKKEESKDELDLNGDGKVDEKDSTIAGKVLANASKKKRKSKPKKKK